MGPAESVAKGLYGISFGVVSVRAGLTVAQTFALTGVPQLVGKRIRTFRWDGRGMCLSRPQEACYYALVS